MATIERRYNSSFRLNEFACDDLHFAAWAIPAFPEWNWYRLHVTTNRALPPPTRVGTLEELREMIEDTLA